MDVNLTQRNLSSKDIDRLSQDPQNRVLQQETTSPKPVLDFADFKRRTYALVDKVLAKEPVPPDTESTYEIPSLYDIIVRHDFTRDDLPKLEFLLHAHECRAKGEPINFAEGMMQLCARDPKK